MSMLTKDDLSAIQKVVKQEVEIVENRSSKRMQKLEKNLSSKITKVQETVDIVQNVIVEHHTQLEQRVTRIEEELRIPTN